VINLQPATTLLQGMETEERIKDLLSQTRIYSFNVITALTDHYVRGVEAKHAYQTNGISQQSFARAQAKLINALRKREWHQSHKQ
jgi:hypothetical protein